LRADADKKLLIERAGRRLRITFNRPDAKTVCNIGLKQLAHSIMDASIAYEALSNGTRNHQEGVKAFREKRRPMFEGR
jgi:1,4-dihydroxy-2-naphthoyl-CoA synthase